MPVEELTPDSFMAEQYGGNAYAQNRFTKAPTFFIRKELPEIDLQEPGTGMSSMNNDPPLASVMDTLSPRVRKMVPQDKGAIYVVPSDSVFETGRVARHEGVHNLLGQIGIETNELRKFNESPSVKPLFDKIESAFVGSTAMGGTDTEMPAYLIGSPRYRAIDPNVRKSYLDKLVKFVAEKDPKAARTLRRMIPADNPLPGVTDLTMEGADQSGFTPAPAAPVASVPQGVYLKPRQPVASLTPDSFMADSQALNPDSFMAEQQAASVAAAPSGPVPGMERLGGTLPSVARAPVPAGLQTPPVVAPPVVPQPGSVAVGSVPILAEAPPPKPVGPAMVTLARIPSGSMPSKKSEEPGLETLGENIANPLRQGKYIDAAKAAFKSPVDMQAVDEQLSNFLVGPIGGFYKGAIEAAIEAGTSPGNLAIVGGVGGAAKLAAAAPTPYIRAAWEAADTALSAYFAGDMAISTAKQGQAAWEAIQHGEWEDAAKDLGFASVSGLFAYAGAKNAVARGLDIKAGVQEGYKLGKLRQAMQDELNRREGDRRAAERESLKPKQIAAEAPTEPAQPKPVGELPPTPGQQLATVELAPEDIAPAETQTPVDTSRQIDLSTPVSIEPGKSFELKTGTYTVKAVDGGRVTFDVELPDGTVMPGKKLAESVFSKMVASAPPPTDAVTEPVRDVQTPAAQPKTPTITPDEFMAQQAEPTVSITPRANLDERGQGVQQRSIEQVKSDPQAVVDQYKKRFGNEISADNAAELFPDYSASPQARADNRGAVARAASWVADQALRQRISEPDKEVPVVFMAGGTGSGKSTMAAEQAASGNVIVYDSTFSDLGGTRKQIQAVLDAGRDVSIQYVYRDPEDSYRAVIKRSEQEGAGRVISPTGHAITHERAADVVRQLADEFSDNPRVTLRYIENSGKPNGLTEGTIELASKGDYAGIRRRIEELDRQLRETKPAEITPGNEPAGESGLRAETGTVLREQVRGETEPVAGRTSTPGLPGPEKVAYHPAPQKLALTGNTFPHRTKIRALGGEWNKAEKAWYVPNTPEVIQSVQGLKGVGLRSPEGESAKSGKDLQDQFGKAVQTQHLKDGEVDQVADIFKRSEDKATPGKTVEQRTPEQQEVLRILGRGKMDAFSLPDYFAISNTFSYEVLNKALISLIKSGDVNHIDMPDGGRGFQRVAKKAEPKTIELAPEDIQPAVPLETLIEKPIIEAGNEPAAASVEPVRASGGGPLESELPQGVSTPGEGEPVAPSSGEGSAVRKPRKRAGSREGSELEPGGGTVSGVVGNPAEPERTFPPRAQDVNTGRHERDYRIPDGRVVSGGPEARARVNIDAIKTLRQIESENRPATVEEQEILAKYVGWGAVPQLFAGRPEFVELQKELQNLLTEDEYSDARRSTTNAHYTGDLIVDAMWKAVQHLGAKPGMSWLEPAVGVGNFFGRQPAELLDGARRVGLDKEPLAGGIAKLLYPDSGIEVVAFEDAGLPKDYFDGAVSNVPFGNFGVHDPEFRGKSYLTGAIHSYFFAKALTHVRPGGVVAFVTSRYTMDSYEPAGVNLRKWLGERAHLIGAIRLPSGTFRQNAGTDVITDVIFLRKKLPEEKALGHSWEKSDRKVLTGGQYGASYPVSINEYYAKNPEHILGKESLTRGQFSDHDYDVKGSATPEQIQAAIESFPRIGFADWTPGKRLKTVALREIKGSEGAKLGGLFFDEKGNLLRRTSKGAAEPVDVGSGVAKRIRGQLAIRDALKKLLDAELANKADSYLDVLRKNLNHVYDRHVKENGPLSNQSNTAVMKGDPDAPLLVSLERKFNKGNKSKDVSPSAEKAPIFSRRMLRPAEVPSSVGDPKDALYISLNEKGRIDWKHMGELTGRTPEQLQGDLAGLVYQDPASKTWQTAEEYLSGSVRKKLKEARAIAKIEPTYKANVEALEKAQPEDIQPGHISALLGVTWVPLDTYGEFATELLGAERPVAVKYVAGNWIVDPEYGNRLNNIRKWSTARVGATEILSESLNMARIKVIDRDSDGSTHVNPDETKVARARQMELQDHFEKWLFSDPKRSDAMARLYNDTQNDLRLRTFEGAHLTLPGMSRDAAVIRGGDLDPHQKAAVWRQIVQPNVLLAHSVGAGKTFQMIAASMELKRLGLIQRPMFVVPNATLTSWQTQFAALYPQARALVFSEKDLEKSARQRAMAQIATGDWDAVVVPHSSFQFLATGDEIFEEHFNQLEHELTEQLQEATEAGLDTRQIKRMEKAKERLLTSLRDRRNADKKDQTVTWEQLGIDQLFIDEFHEFKKLGFATKQGNVAGIDQEGNQKTFDLLMKLRYTQKHGRGVVGATGTPITNTMGELYTVMRYLIEPELQARGLGRFDEWAANFGRTVDVFEPKIEGGGYQMKARFAQFVNIPELAQLLRSFADVVTSDMINLPRPEIAGGKRQAVETQLTPDQEAYLEELRDRAKSIRADPRGSLPDNMLSVYTDAGKMAMDIRMVQPGAADDPNGRLNVAADNIYRLWKDSAKNKGTQLVMSDMGKPAEAGGSKDFSAYDELIKKLVERGIPREEISHIYQAKNKAQRARLFQDVNDGKIRVVLGSTQKMGVGVNIQQRLYAMHHLDVPHRPSDLEQREGRILRQGNENPEVHLFYYVTKGSLDEAKFANVVRKAKFINQVMQGKSEVREAEDVGGMVPSLEMFQAMASGDPRVMRKMEVDAEVDRLSGVYSGWKNQQYKIRRDLSEIPGRVQHFKNRVEVFQRDMAIRDTGGNKWSVGKQQFEGEKISKDINEALLKEIIKVANKKGEDVEIGKARGLPLLASLRGYSENSYVKIDIGDGMDVTISGKDMESAGIDVFRRINNQIEGLEQDITDASASIERVKTEQKNLQNSVEETWPYTTKFQGLVEEQKKLVKDLGADKGDDAAAVVGEGSEISDKSVEAQEPEVDDTEEDDNEKPLGLTERKTGERGSAPLDFLSLGAAKFVQKDVVPNLKNAARAMVAGRGDILRLIAPAARGPEAKETALTIREHAAMLARQGDRAQAALEVARKFFDGEDREENLKFMDRIENGQEQPNPQLQNIADTMRKMLDRRREEVQELGTGKLETFYENYFPHMWKQPDDAERLFKQWFAKRPMEGSRSFLKQRKIPTIKDGIEMGLEPESTNPVDLVILKIREMDKYLFAHHALDDMKETGLLKFVRATEKAPDGFTKIDDKVATVYEGKTEQGSIAIRGHYMAPEPAATVINNYLSPGLRKYGAFRAYIGLANVLNQFQLGWSAYHLGFTSFDSGVSRFALGVQQLANRKGISRMEGFATMASSPVAPFRGIWQGDKLLREWYKPGTQGQEIGLLVDAMMMAGGRARMDRFYQTTVTKKMMTALRQGNVLGAAMRLPFALTELASRPILEWIVPRQKMAVFADLAREELAKAEKYQDPARLREALAKAWDSVDNRMGQLVYDNLFWNKTLKDLLMASVRSVGWNLGTIREILGGGRDLVAELSNKTRGRDAEFTTRMAYIVALPIVAGLIGAMLHYLNTGERPKDLKDYFFPRRDRRGTPGWEKRMTLPSYVKDVVHWAHDPYQTAKGKVHPLLSTLLEMLSNKDYFDRPIRNENDPLVKQMRDLAVHAAETFQPMATRPLTAPDKRNQETTAEKVLPFIGITEAPKYVKEIGKPARRRMASGR